MSTLPLCVVAGVGPGLGLALARRFARGGFAVALLARRAASLAQCCAVIEADGGTAYGYAVDLTDAAALQGVLATICRERGDPAVAIYNASVWRATHPMQFPVEQFSSDVSLCVTGALVMAQQCYAAMQRAGQGSLLFTGSGIGLHPETGADAVALTVGKAALRAMVLALAPSLARDGIHCCTVTVDGAIAAGSAFDPDRIAEQFWRVHQQARAQWQPEVIFKG